MQTTALESQPTIDDPGETPTRLLGYQGKTVTLGECDKAFGQRRNASLIEMSRRFVEQDWPWSSGKCHGKGHPLALTRRQLENTAIKEGAHAEKIINGRVKFSFS